MIQLYNVVEFLATFTELFVAYLVLRTIFYDKRKLTNYYIDAIMAASGTIMVLCCNKIALFSYFTIIIVGIYLSVSARIIYRINYITLFSAVGFYLLCMNSFDFLCYR